MNALKVLQEYFSHFLALVVFWLSTLTWVVGSLYYSRLPPFDVLREMAVVILLMALLLAAVSAVLTMLGSRMLDHWDPKQTAPLLWRVTLCLNPPIPAMLFIGLYYAVKGTGPVVLRYIGSIIEDVGKNRHQPFH